MPHNGNEGDSDLQTSAPLVKPRSRIAVIALALAVIALGAAVAAGFGHRFGWWSFGTGFTVLRNAAIAAMVGVALAIIGAYQTRPRGGRRGMPWALTALVIAATTAAVPLSWLWIASQVPPIHDISTDTDHPPKFVAILPLRADAPNSTRYGGAAVAAQQHRAYPDILPLSLHVPAAQAFTAAEATARDLGWHIVAADLPAGRIEATDTTFWFGFTDDIVVRLAPQPDGTVRIDARSVSRVGRSDVGANARRLHRFLHGLAHRLDAGS